MDDLQPPRKSVELQDPGAHELDASSEDHFSDAQEGQLPSGADRSDDHSPIPTTRVERVDDQPAYGEVPGTPAYKMRMQDAVPDEVEVVPDGQRSRSASRVSLGGSRPWTPGGSPIPKTVVEKVDPEKPSYGDVPGTAAHELRKADAEPDIILKAPQVPNREPAPSLRTPEQPPNDSLRDEEDDDFGEPPGAVEAAPVADDADDFGNDFGDDFDEFEEGEVGGEDDFGDFDDGFQEGQGDTAFAESPPPPAPVPITPSIPPILNFTDMDAPEEVSAAAEPYVQALFPSLSQLPPFVATDDARSIFLSERSVSLWSQLVAPPPLQPPNWVRSRIRRLFLVSLGVPVDLDEILPASKQKKLVLPSINLPGDRSPGDRSPRPSYDDRGGANGAVERLKKGGNGSNTSVDSSTSASKRAAGSSKRRSQPKAPELDVRATTMLGSTTEEALSGFTDEELQNHVKKLEELRVKAEEALQFWQKRKESAIGDKEAFEAVIENLVKHAKKVRK